MIRFSQILLIVFQLFILKLISFDKAQTNYIENSFKWLGHLIKKIYHDYYSDKIY